MNWLPSWHPWGIHGFESPWDFTSLDPWWPLVGRWLDPLVACWWYGDWGEGNPWCFIGVESFQDVLGIPHSHSLEIPRSISRVFELKKQLRSYVWCCEPAALWHACSRPGHVSLCHELPKDKWNVFCWKHALNTCLLLQDLQVVGS